MARFIIIDHDMRFSIDLKQALESLGHEVTQTNGMDAGILSVQSDRFDVVLFNVHMPDGDGIDSLPKLMNRDDPPEVVALADAGDPEEAEQLIRLGAWDYIERPSNPRAMALSLVRILDYRTKTTLKRNVEVPKGSAFEDIAGSGPRMKACLDVSMLAAQSDANVLLSGETGTGKELFAWAIHNSGGRAKEHFVIVDCAALPETLVESTLFGHERGAYTGADRSQKGLIQRADRGTLFLDEVGELPLHVQRSFLRVLQEHRFRPVGGTQEIWSDFRLIAATNRNLDAMVERKQFRKDLLFRLRAFSIHLPPLRDRLEDIKEIVMHHMPRICKYYGCEQKTFSEDFFDALATYSWPGNVRELVNALERAISVAQQDSMVYPRQLPTYLRVELARTSISGGEKTTTSEQGAPGKSKFMPRWAEAKETAMRKAEQKYLKDLLSFTQGDIPEAIQVSGLSRSRLYALLKKHRIRVWDVTE